MEKKTSKKPNQVSNKMTTRNIIILVVSVCVILAIIIGIVVWNNSKKKQPEPIAQGPENLDTYVLSMDVAQGESEIKEVNSKLLEKKSAEGIQIEEIKYISGGGQTRVKLKLKNTTEEEIREKYVKLTYMDSKGKEMETLDMFVASIPAEESTIVYNNTAIEITKAVEYKMQVVDMNEETVLPEGYEPPAPEEE